MTTKPITPEQKKLIDAARRATYLLMENVKELRLNLLRTQQIVEEASGIETEALSRGEQDLCALISTLRWAVLDLDAIEDGRLPSLPALRRFNS